MKAITIRKYGARLISPPEVEQSFIQSMRLQNRLWNALVETENKNRDAYTSTVTESDAELAALAREHAEAETTLDALYAQRNRIRSAKRSKNAEEAAEFSAAIKKQIQQLKVIRASMKNCRSRAKETAKPKLEALELERRASVKEVVHQAGLWWCHSELVVTSFDTARAKTLKTPGTKLRFRRFEGEGRIGVRFSPGIKLSAPPATSMLKVREATPEELGHLKANRSKKQIKAVDIRIGKPDENKLSPTATFLVTIHDGIPLELDLPLKTVTVKREMHAGTAKWFMVFMFVDPEAEEKEIPLQPKAAGIDFGWRQVRAKEFGDRHGIRVATIIDTKGVVDHITLPPDMLYRFERADSTRSILDSSANEFWESISPLFTDTVLKAMDETEWLRVIVEKARRAKSPYPKLMLTIAEAHGKNPVLGEVANQSIQAWARSAKRLSIEVFGIRRRVLEHRKHIYRNVAARLAREYGLIAIKNTDFKKLSMLKKADGEDTELHETARSNRVLAAPSELRSSIILAAKREQREIVMVDPAYQTATCSACEHVQSGPLTDIFFVCENCGKLHDQDENSARNSLKFALQEHRPDETMQNTPTMPD